MDFRMSNLRTNDCIEIAGSNMVLVPDKYTEKELLEFGYEFEDEEC
jgi:hypothetical protein